MTTTFRKAGSAAICAVVLALSLPVGLPAAVAATTAEPSVTASSVALLTLGQTATLTLDGKVHHLGRLGSVMQTVDATPSGDLVVADNMLTLITPSGSVQVLSGAATVDGFAVSPNGRYVAWSVSPGGYKAKKIYQLLMYDLQKHKLTHTLLVKDQVQPVGFLDDGRVGVQGQELSTQSYLWTPSTGALAKVGDKRYPSLDQASGHLLVLSDENDGCSAVIKDARTGKGFDIDTGRECEFLARLSPDGSRWSMALFSANDSGFVALPGVADARTGKADYRLAKLFYREQASITDEAWLDSDHLLVIDNRPEPHSKYGRQLEQLCAVPVASAPSCTTVKDLGPYLRQSGDTPQIGPDVWLAHPLGQ